MTNKFALLKIDDKTAPKAMVSRKRAVEAGLGICNEIYDPTNVSKIVRVLLFCNCRCFVVQVMNVAGQT